MQFKLNGDGTKLEVHLTLTWSSLRALLKAVITVITATAALLYAPEVIRLFEALGR